jgi:hypothetical protein
MHTLIIGNVIILAATHSEFLQCTRVTVCWLCTLNIIIITIINIVCFYIWQQSSPHKYYVIMRVSNSGSYRHQSGILSL